MDNVMKHATEIDHFAQHNENQRLFSNKMINNENRANRFPNTTMDIQMEQYIYLKLISSDISKTKSLDPSFT